MKLSQNPIQSLLAKGQVLRQKKDRTRIRSASTAEENPTCSPKMLSVRKMSGDANSKNLSLLEDNKPVLFGDDKELHDPNFVRHNWEMMSGEVSPVDFVGRSTSPWRGQQRSSGSRRNSLMSSKAGSSRPSSRSSNEGGLRLRSSPFTAPSNYGTSKEYRSVSMRGLQVEGSILRDEEAILDGDDSSSDEDDADDDNSDDDRRSTRGVHDFQRGRGMFLSAGPRPRGRSMLNPNSSAEASLHKASRGEQAEHTSLFETAALPLSWYDPVDRMTTAPLIVVGSLYAPT